MLTSEYSSNVVSPSASMHGMLTSPSPLNERARNFANSLCVSLFLSECIIKPRGRTLGFPDVFVLEDKYFSTEFCVFKYT